MQGVWVTLVIVLFWGSVLALGGEECGKRATSVSSLPSHTFRIVGGRQSEPMAWPWSAAVLHKIIQTRFCGAVLIHPQWALTAAHCFKFNFPDDEWFVEIGKYNSSREESFSQYRNVAKIIRHPRFDDSHGSFNDLALLRLNESVQLDQHNYTINAVCLSDFDLLDRSELQDCVTIGWGNEHKEGASSDVLREVRLPLVSAERCFAKHEFKFDSNSQICAGGLEQGGSGTCFGDSGGPLMCKSKQERWHLVGITSYGKACALPQIADVFTKVAAYYEWILENIESAHL